MTPDPETKERRCARKACGRRFRFQRRTKKHCSDACRDAEAHAAKRARDSAHRPAVVPLAVSIQCPICRQWVFVQVRSGGTPQRYCGRRSCRKTAEKLAAYDRS